MTDNTPNPNTQFPRSLNFRPPKGLHAVVRSETDLLNDRERASRIQIGDAESIRGFVEEHYSSVLRFMRHLTRSTEDAEDLTQQAFIKARESIAGFRGNSSLRTWLHRVAFHEYNGASGSS